MPTDRGVFIVDPTRFSRMVEGKIRHHITTTAVAEGEEIIFYQSGSMRKAVFLVTFVDVNRYDDVHGDELTIYTIALKLQEWASSDTA
jgi:hypothetical protein